MIEGDLRAAAGNFNRHAILGALVSVTLSWRIPILHTDTLEETALLLAFAASQSKADDVPKAVRHGSKPKKIRTRRLRFLQGLPGVGPKVAASLLRRFGSVRRIVDASAEELAEISAIGPNKVAAIRELLDGKEEENMDSGKATWKSRDRIGTLR